jgi:hypothetical protein
MTTFYVSISGDDAANGSQTTPFATVRRAVETARALGTDVERRIIVSGGRYTDVAVTLDGRDSGLTIEAAEGEAPILCGGRQITGWREEGRFWVADLPDSAGVMRDARMLEVNGRFCPRARLPEEGAYTHESVFDVRWMSTTLGGWERKPTDDELTTLRYKEGDLGLWLEPGNAELTIYHSWDDSMVGVSAIDEVTRTVRFSAPAGHPAGAFGGHIAKANTYVVWNVREGMSRPGQWYLDRVRGQLVYWPLPEEEIAAAVAYLPSTEAILSLWSSEDAPLTNLTLRRLGLTISNTPMMAGDFGAMRLPGAVDAQGPLTACKFEDLRIWNVAGHGIRLSRGAKHRDIVISGCEVRYTGAGGIYLHGDGSLITENLVQHVGLIYPAAIGIFGGGDGYVISHNNVYDTSYTAINGGGGKGSVIEYNDMARAMQVLEDGAAIYVIFATELIMRGNVARDIADTHGACHAYYLDEQSERCVVTGNLAVNVPSASHNHWARHCRVENNVFINAGDVNLLFPRSEDFTIARNVILATGGIQFRNADAVAHYERNICFTGADRIEAVRYVDGMYRPMETLPLVSGDDMLNADPLFVDMEAGDFRFRPGSPALEMGIIPIDVSTAGRTRR